MGTRLFRALSRRFYPKPLISKFIRREVIDSIQYITEPGAHLCAVSPGGGAWGRGAGLHRQPARGRRGALRVAGRGRRPRTLQLQRLSDGLQEPGGGLRPLGADQRRGAGPGPHRHLAEGPLLMSTRPGSPFKGEGRGFGARRGGAPEDIHGD